MLVMEDLFPAAMFPDAKNIFANGDPFSKEPLRRPDGLVVVEAGCTGDRGGRWRWRGPPPFTVSLALAMYSAREVHSKLRASGKLLEPPRPGMPPVGPISLSSHTENDESEQPEAAQQPAGQGDSNQCDDDHAEVSWSQATTLEMDPWAGEPNFDPPASSDDYIQQDDPVEQQLAGMVACGCLEFLDDNAEPIPLDPRLVSGVETPPEQNEVMTNRSFWASGSPSSESAGPLQCCDKQQQQQLQPQQQQQFLWKQERWQPRQHHMSGRSVRDPSAAGRDRTAGQESAPDSAR